MHISTLLRSLSIAIAWACSISHAASFLVTNSATESEGTVSIWDIYSQDGDGDAWEDAKATPNAGPATGAESAAYTHDNYPWGLGNSAYAEGRSNASATYGPGQVTSATTRAISLVGNTVDAKYSPGISSISDVLTESTLDTSAGSETTPTSIIVDVYVSVQAISDQDFSSHIRGEVGAYIGSSFLWVGANPQDTPVPIGLSTNFTDYRTVTDEITGKTTGRGKVVLEGAAASVFVKSNLRSASSGASGTESTIGVGIASAKLTAAASSAPSQLFSTLNTPYSEGDLNNDGVVDAADIDYLATNALIGPDSVYEGADPFSDLDLNATLTFEASWDWNFVVDSDSDYLIKELLGTTYGDVNLDGLLEYDDFAIIAGNLGTPGGWADGDVSGNGFVDAVDIAIWRLNDDPGGDEDGIWSSLVYAEYAGALTIPEPASLLLCGLTIASSLARSSRAAGRLRHR